MRHVRKMDILNDAIVSLLTSRLGNEAEISVPDSPIEGTEGFEQPVVCTVTVKSRRAIQTLFRSTIWEQKSDLEIKKTNSKIDLLSC